MLPADLLAALQAGDVLLVGRRGGISALIRAVTHSRWSHVAMIDQSASGAWVVLEATFPAGVAARKVETITEDSTVEHLAVRRYGGVAAAFIPEAVRAMWLETGLPYANDVNIEIALGIPVSARDGVNCVAAVNEAYHTGCQVWLIDPTIPTPDALAQSPKLVDIWYQERPLAKAGPDLVGSTGGPS